MADLIWPNVVMKSSLFCPGAAGRSLEDTEGRRIQISEAGYLYAHKYELVDRYVFHLLTSYTSYTSYISNHLSQCISPTLEPF